jgi:cell shape-determining protein MreC
MKKFSSITRVNSHHTSRANKLKKIALVGAVALLLFFLVPKFVAQVASLVLTPVHALQTWITKSSDSFPQFFRERSTLIAQLDALTETQSARSGDTLTAQLLSKENVELRALLGDSGEKRIVAGVIGRPNVVPYDVLVLDKGSEDGIVDGAPVFIGDDAVIGIVSKTFSKSAVVELITTPGFTVSVYILGPNIYTNAVGMGGGQLKVGVPQGIKLTEGDLVILPGASAGIYGAISTVHSVATEPEQYGYVSPEIPLAGLRLVSVGSTPHTPINFEEAQNIVRESKQQAFQVPVPEGMLVTTELASSTASTTATTTTSSTSVRTQTP